MWDHDGSYDSMMNGAGGWMTGFAVLALVLLFIATLAVLANLFFHLTDRSDAVAPSAAGTPDARRILDDRLARGEVSAEDYQSVRALLDAG